MAEETVYEGTLRREGSFPFIEGDGGERLLDGHPIWRGYITHFEGRRVRARFLSQRDYESNLPILLVWPREEPASPFFELYYNERLVRYPASTFGHIALNIDGLVFNYSHLVNENEVMTPEEYLYRPALGEFAPHPVTGGFDLSDPARPHYDKFGRSFMRTIHVARVEGADVPALMRYNLGRMRHIHETPVNPRRPHKYAEFRFFTRNCSTIIRDGLREIGFVDVRGIMPRDMFICAVSAFLRESRRGRISLRLYTMPQLMVPEAKPSRLSPLFNPLNRIRRLRLRGLTGA
ncbi:MAG: hypothetical protein JW807_08290 [Spirochaetes bacterium]|nr:hypothetical protein [Spirochaetota bacterium]